MIGEKINERVQSILAPGKRREAMSGEAKPTTSLEEIMQRLSKLAEQQNTINQNATETVQDDADFNEDVLAKIETEEALVRPVLALFGLDYDALIDEGSGSVYGRAVQANPTILQHVAQAKSPVLAALQVVAAFKPYAEFMERYGENPEDIKKAILAEAEGHKKEQKKHEEKVPSSPFSKPYAAPEKDAKGAPVQKSLSEIFAQ